MHVIEYVEKYRLSLAAGSELLQLCRDCVHRHGGNNNTIPKDYRNAFSKLTSHSDPLENPIIGNFDMSSLSALFHNIPSIQYRYVL